MTAQGGQSVTVGHGVPSGVRNLRVPRCGNDDEDAMDGNGNGNGKLGVSLPVADTVAQKSDTVSKVKNRRVYGFHFVLVRFTARTQPPLS